MGLISPQSACSLFRCVMSLSAALYTHMETKGRAALKKKKLKCNTIERQTGIYCTNTPPPPPCRPATLPSASLQGTNPLPFHLGVIVTQHQRPRSRSALAWRGGRGYMGGRRVEVTPQKGQLGTRWTVAQKPQREKEGEGKMERERESCEVTFSALSLSKP